MLRDHQKVLIFSATLLLLIPIVQSKMVYPKEGHNAKESVASALSDDELSYAMSGLSMDELRAIYQVLEKLDENDDQGTDNNVAKLVGGEARYMPGRQARFKRENSDTPTEDDQENSLPNVDEEYIKQLDESFPNVVEQSNQDDKEKEHVRVKRT